MWSLWSFTCGFHHLGLMLTLLNSYPPLNWSPLTSSRIFKQWHWTVLYSKYKTIQCHSEISIFILGGTSTTPPKAIKKKKKKQPQLFMHLYPLQNPRQPIGGKFQIPSFCVCLSFYTNLMIFSKFSSNSLESVLMPLQKECV